MVWEATGSVRDFLVVRQSTDLVSRFDSVFSGSAIYRFGFTVFSWFGNLPVKFPASVRLEDLYNKNMDNK